ncbi:MAG: type II toxin-antitoxin system PemK/MazF family toxin [Terracidiphilus sp.]|jgi:mRNA interferase MazF
MAGKSFRGMVVDVSLDPVVDHEQGRTRPCVVVQNDVGNRFASTTIIVPLTAATRVKVPSPIYVPVKMGDGGTTKDSCILCDQIRVVDQSRFGRVHGALAPETMARLDTALLISLGLPGYSPKRFS